MDDGVLFYSLRFLQIYVFFFLFSPISIGMWHWEWKVGIEIESQFEMYSLKEHINNYPQNKQSNKDAPKTNKLIELIKNTFPFR